MKYVKQTFLISSMLLANSFAWAGYVNVSSGLGYDSNPYRLNESLIINEDYYWHNSASVKVEPTDSWDMYVKVDGKNYSEDGNADSLKLQSKTSLSFELFEPLTIKLGAGYDSFDKSYISRSSGTPYFSDGKDATDRYDYQRWQGELQAKLKLSKNHKLLYAYQYREQSYEDLTHLDLSNLDFVHHKSTLTWQYRVSKKLLISPLVEYRWHIFDDKRSKDRNGDDIERSALEYQYFGGGVKISYHLNKANRLYTRLYRLKREDNAGGYYDTVYNQVYLSWKHKFSKTNSLRLSAAYSELEYQRGNGNQEGEDETPSNEGWRLSVDYEHAIFELGDSTVKWYSDISYADFDSEDTVYLYDRFMLETGLKVRF